MTNVLLASSALVGPLVKLLYRRVTLDLSKYTYRLNSPLEQVKELEITINSKAEGQGGGV